MGGQSCGTGWEERLARTRSHLEQWRRRRRRGERIPEDLWGEAVALARERGVSWTASALRVEYYGLKRRLREAGAGSRVEFVEVPVAGLLGSPECVVQIEDGAGTRLRVELRGAATSGVEAVARALWGALR